ncbi:FecR family protein [Olivibacter sp. XZL3]|uniref:FecR family protein n=1 Tax=Olivibacter sp. XZL3 TaxID=1735116 RepID=UPI0010648AFD|nr:FecR family protein [Olivibacter sp. XZL3]
MSKEHFELAERISRYLQGKLNPEEEAELLARAAEDPVIYRLLKQYEDGEQLAEDLAFMDSVDKEADWQLMLKKQEETTVPFHNTTFTWRAKIGWWVAACFLIISGAFWLWKIYTPVPVGIIPDTQYGHKNDVLPGGNSAILTLSDGREVELGIDNGQIKDGNAELAVGEQLVNYIKGDEQDTARHHTIRTPKGGTYIVELSDGTKAWLNAESALEFPVAFGNDSRWVKLLEGEVYFEVAQQATAPFLVYSSDFQVEVLGTAFNVNTYTNGRSKAILTAGKIKVKRGEEQQVIEAGYAVTAFPDKLSVQEVDMEEALAWKDGYFYFDGKNLQQILTEVARWYDVKVEYETEMPKKKYRGGMKRSVTLANVCDVLTDLSGKAFSIEGKKLIVKSLRN